MIEIRSWGIPLFVVAVLLVTAGSCNSAPNTPPIADAGSDRDVPIGAAVELDGSASVDPDSDPLAFLWTLSSVPAGSNAVLQNADSSISSFTPDVAGSYLATLGVSDGAAEATAEVTITATDDAPVLSNIADRSTPRSDSIEVEFTITDEVPESVVVTGSSDDQVLVSDTDIEILGDGAARTVRITPSLTGEGVVTITLVAVDTGGLEDSESFDLGVTVPFETELAKLTASDAAESDGFASSVSVSGESAIMGAPSDDDAGFSSGAAYMFERVGETWVETTKLIASDAATDASFGFSVSMSGDVAIGGALNADDPVAGTRVGAAYVFERVGNVWSEVAKLTASDAADEDGFGISVSVSGDVMIVGALWDDDAGEESGSAYVFERGGSGWSQVAKLTASDDAAGDNFGYSVSVNGSTAVVGALNDDDAGDDSGSVYVFERTGSEWSEIAKLTASDGADGAGFGSSVSVDGDTLIAGAETDINTGIRTGSAYVFERTGSGWSEVAKLIASDAADDDNFGFSVSVSGDVVMVGAERNDDAGSDSGAAYVFERVGGDWVEVANLTASDAAAGDRFGSSVSASGEVAMVGAPGSSVGGVLYSGAAYVFVK